MTDDIRTGLRRSAGLAGSTFVLGVTFGALARAHGWGLGAPMVASLAIFSGSAQFALLAVLAGGGAAWTAVASGALINLRFFPMALAAAPRVAGAGGSGARSRPRPSWTALGSWRTKARGASTAACCSAPRSRSGRRGSPAPSSASSSPHPADCSNATGLDVVFPAFFALLLFDEVRRARSARIAAAGAAVITAVLLLALPAGPALLGGARCRAPRPPTHKTRALVTTIWICVALTAARGLHDQGHRPAILGNRPLPARQGGHRTPRPGAPRRPRHLRHPRPPLVLSQRATRSRRPHRRRRPHHRPTNPSLHHRRRHRHRHRPRRALTSATEANPKRDTRSYEPRRPTPDYPSSQSLLLRPAVSACCRRSRT